MRTKANFLKSGVIMATAMAALSGTADAVDLVATADATLVTLITVTQNTQMTFGNIAVIPGSDNTAFGSITLNSVGTVTDPVAEANNANIVALTGATAGNYTVFVGDTAAIPMTVTTGTLVDLVNGGNDLLTLSAIDIGTLSTGTGTSGDCSGGCVLTSAAASGNIIFPVGATITMAVGNGTYADGTYTGSFTLTAIYQ